MNALRVFARVARLGTFTGAARSLELPKATVSGMVAALERRLGTRLLERTTRRVTLTEPGRVYLASCLRVLDEVERGRHAVEAMSASPRGLLRVSAPFALSRGVLGPLLPGFRERFPELRVVVDVTNRAPGPLEDDVDVALRIGPVEAADAQVRPVTVFMTRLYASRGYLAARRAPRHPLELADHALLGRADRDGRLRWTLRRGAEVSIVDAYAHVGVCDPDTGATLIRHGAGIGWLPPFLARDGAADGELTRCLDDWDAEPVALNAVLPSAGSQSPKTAAFVEFLRRSIGAYA